MTIPQHIKDRIDAAREFVAMQNSYPTYEDYYNWISRDVQYPAVVAQLIEAFTEEVVYHAMCEPKDNLIADLKAENERLRSRVAALKEPKDDNY